MARKSLEVSPVLSAISSSTHSRAHTPSSSVPSTPIVPNRAPSPKNKALHDSNAFLTALAAQERRVLELKEELQRAEISLELLKKQWAFHETTKKRNELRQVEPLQLMSIPTLTTHTSEKHEMPTVRRQQERRKPRSLTTRQPQPQRTVFSGSRHTKTLSLLSPTASAGNRGNATDTSAPSKTRRGTIEGPVRSSTVPRLSKALNPSSNAPASPRPRKLVSGAPKDPLLDAGKQLVGDFKEGFWTFFEDLRQATVGEEIDTTSGNLTSKPTSASRLDTTGHTLTPQRDIAAANPFPTRRLSLYGESKHSERHPSKSSKALKTQSSCNEHTIKPSTKLKHQRNLTIETASNDLDGWDLWDSPPSNKSLSHSSTSICNADSLASPTNYQSSLATSYSSSDATPRPKKAITAPEERKEIPWPVLTKLSPGKLVRTASTLMSDWERSITSPNDGGGARSTPPQEVAGAKLDKLH